MTIKSNNLTFLLQILTNHVICFTVNLSKLLKTMNIATFIEALESGTLSRGNWNHFGHLRTIMFYSIREKDVFRAIKLFRCTAIQYATSINPTYSCIHRYNQTMTEFWAYEVQKFIEEHHDKNFETLEQLLQKSKLIDKNYIHQFYSESLLYSEKAAATYVPPDLSS